MEILGKKSTNTTQGHRYSLNREIKIINQKGYVESLKKAQSVESDICHPGRIIYNPMAQSQSLLSVFSYISSAVESPPPSL